MKELIQDNNWWKNHNVGIGHYATIKTININTKEKRYFIGSIEDVQKFLGNDWNVFSI